MRGTPNSKYPVSVSICLDALPLVGQAAGHQVGRYIVSSAGAVAMPYSTTSRRPCCPISSGPCTHRIRVSIVVIAAFTASTVSVSMRQAVSIPPATSTPRVSPAVEDPGSRRATPLCHRPHISNTTVMRKPYCYCVCMHVYL